MFRVLFEGENDFMVCVRDSFPHLSTRKLTRVEWCKVGMWNAPKVLNSFLIPSFPRRSAN